MLHRWFFRDVVYRTAVTVRGEGAVFRYLAELQRVERAHPDELASLSRQRLADIIRHAQSCPWYADRFEGRLAEGDAPELFLQRGPILERGDLRTQRNALMPSRGPRRVRKKTTGGSTGEPVTVLKDPEATAREMAASWLAYGWFGIGIGDRGVRFWGDPSSAKRKLRFMAADLAMHRLRFSAFAFDDADLEEYWLRCRRFRPAYFYGYVSMMVRLARNLQERGVDGRTLDLKVVICTSEVLQDAERVLLEETFGCPVQNEYGCGEVGPIAYSCPKNHFHIMTPNVHMEIVDADGRSVPPDTPGEILITDLTNRAMPLIRYRLGDRGILAGRPCECGRPYPVLKEVWGRAYDFIDAPDGRRYHGEFFMYMFEELRDRGFDFERFQIQQLTPDRLIVRIMPNRPNDQLERLLRAKLSQAMPQMSVDVAWVDDIPRAPSGKMRVIVNELAGTGSA